MQQNIDFKKEFQSRNTRSSSLDDWSSAEILTFIRGAFIKKQNNLLAKGSTKENKAASYWQALSSNFKNKWDSPSFDRTTIKNKWNSIKISHDIEAWFEKEIEDIQILDNLESGNDEDEIKRNTVKIKTNNILDLIKNLNVKTLNFLITQLIDKQIDEILKKYSNVWIDPSSEINSELSNYLLEIATKNKIKNEWIAKNKKIKIGTTNDEQELIEHINDFIEKDLIVLNKIRIATDKLITDFLSNFTLNSIVKSDNLKIITDFDLRNYKNKKINNKDIEENFIKDFEKLIDSNFKAKLNNFLTISDFKIEKLGNFYSFDADLELKLGSFAPIKKKILFNLDIPEYRPTEDFRELLDEMIEEANKDYNFKTNQKLVLTKINNNDKNSFFENFIDDNFIINDNEKIINLKAKLAKFFITYPGYKLETSEYKFEKDKSNKNDLNGLLGLKISFYNEKTSQNQIIERTNKIKIFTDVSKTFAKMKSYMEDKNNETKHFFKDDFFKDDFFEDGDTTIKDLETLKNIYKNVLYWANLIDEIKTNISFRKENLEYSIQDNNESMAFIFALETDWSKNFNLPTKFKNFFKIDKKIDAKNKTIYFNKNFINKLKKELNKNLDEKRLKTIKNWKTIPNDKQANKMEAIDLQYIFANYNSWLLEWERDLKYEINPFFQDDPYSYRIDFYTRDLEDYSAVYVKKTIENIHKKIITQNKEEVKEEIKKIHNENIKKLLNQKMSKSNENKFVSEFQKAESNSLKKLDALTVNNQSKLDKIKAEYKTKTFEIWNKILDQKYEEEKKKIEGYKLTDEKRKELLDKLKKKYDKLKESLSKEKLEDISFKKLLKEISDLDLDLDKVVENESLISDTFKMTLVGTSVLLGAAGLTAFGTSVKIIRSKKKFKSHLKIKSRKGLILLTTLVGVASTLSSAGLGIFVFITQGGF